MKKKAGNSYRMQAVSRRPRAESCTEVIFNRKGSTWLGVHEKWSWFVTALHHVFLTIGVVAPHRGLSEEVAG